MKKQYLYNNENTTYIFTIDFNMISEKRYAYLWELFKQGTIIESEVLENEKI